MTQSGARGVDEAIRPVPGGIRPFREKPDVSDQHLSSDLDDLIRQLDGLDTPGDSPGGLAQCRFIVATDWSSAVVPLAMLKAFRVIVPAEFPVQLVFAVPHEPTPDDAECVHVLLEGAGSAGDMTGIEVLSFAQAGQAPYDAAVIPAGDVDQVIMEVAGVISRMHDTVRRIEGARKQGRSVADDPTLNVGSLAKLRERLEVFAA